MGRRNALIDYIRLFCIAMIILCHFFTWGGVKSHFDLTYLLVEFFPLTAGYLFMKMIAERKGEMSVAGYAWRRFKRLFPYTFLSLVPLFLYISKQSDLPLLKQVLFTLPEAFLISYNGMNTLWATVNGPTWIILSMFLVEIVLFALCSVCQLRTFTYFILPVSVLWGYGYMAAGIVGSQEAWGGLVNVGVFRAYIAICLGCLLYFAAERIRKIRWTRAGIIAMSIAEYSAYFLAVSLLVLCTTENYGDASHRYVITALLAIGICITFSDVTVSNRVKDNAFSRYCGKLSLSLCVTHYGVVLYFFHHYENPWAVTPAFLASAIAVAVVFQLVVDGVIWLTRRVSRAAKTALIQQRQF